MNLKGQQHINDIFDLTDVQRRRWLWPACSFVAFRIKKKLSKIVGRVFIQYIILRNDKAPMNLLLLVQPYM